MKLGKVGIAYSVLFILVSLCVFFLVAVQVFEKKPEVDLKALVKEQEESLEKLNDELLWYKNELQNIKYENENPEDTLVKLRTELKFAQDVAGLSTLEGEGVIVVFDDAQSGGLIEDNTSNAVIHDLYILQIINELRDSGAEAISINGHRMLGISEVRCAGNVVSINNKRTGAPFVIKAIGDSQTLSAGLNMKNGVVEIFEKEGMKVDVEEKEKITIEAYDGELEFNIASTVEYVEE